MSKQIKQKRLKGAEMTDTPTGIMKQGAIDSYYIEAYLDNPKLSQLDVLKLAMINAEHTGKATRQHAYVIHDRNRDKINSEMVKLASDLKNLSISVIKELMIKAESESVRLSAAQTGTKDLFPNVSVSKQVTIDDIDSEIKQLEQDIANQEGMEIRH